MSNNASSEGVSPSPPSQRPQSARPSTHSDRDSTRPSSVVSTSTQPPPSPSIPTANTSQPSLPIRIPTPSPTPDELVLLELKPLAHEELLQYTVRLGSDYRRKLAEIAAQADDIVYAKVEVEKWKELFVSTLETKRFALAGCVILGFVMVVGVVLVVLKMTI